MRELTYTILELERRSKKEYCYFCRSLNEAVCQIRIRSKLTEKIVQNSKACQGCKEKFENNELLKCSNCGRLERQTEFDYSAGKWICYCIRNNESQEKELPVLPQKSREATFYEQQINELREKEKQLTEEIEAHLEALKVSEIWNKNQKEELVKENRSLKERIRQLEEQLAQLNNQSTSQIEAKETKKWPWRLKK